MYTRKTISIFGIITLLFMSQLLFAGGSSGNEHPPEVTRQVLEEIRDRGNIPGMAALTVSEGDIVGEYYLGWASIEDEIPVSEQSRFMIASVSKPVTVTAVMILVERGSLDLDADINRYLPFGLENPNFPEAPITARMLMAHSSSLRDNWDVLDPLYTVGRGGGDSPISLAELCEQYFEPGERFYSDDNFYTRHPPGRKTAYCNMGYALLGLIVEEIDGRSFDAFCREEIFDPLGMESAGWFLRDHDPDLIAMPYDVGRRSTEALGHYGYPDYPDGQLRLTITDYARFMSIYLNDGAGILQPRTVEEVMSVPFPDASETQAHGWTFDAFENGLVRRIIGNIPGHTGGDPGVSTYIVFDPYTRSMAILFLNGMHTSTAALKAVYIDALKVLAGEAGLISG